MPDSHGLEECANIKPNFMRTTCNMFAAVYYVYKATDDSLKAIFVDLARANLLTQDEAMLWERTSSTEANMKGLLWCSGKRGFERIHITFMWPPIWHSVLDKPLNGLLPHTGYSN